MCKLHRYIFPIYVYFHFTAPTVDCTVFVRVSLLSTTEPLFIVTINAFVQPNSRNVDCVVVISLPGRQCVVWLHRIMGRDQRRRIYFPVCRVVNNMFSSSHYSCLTCLIDVSHLYISFHCLTNYHNSVDSRVYRSTQIPFG